MTAPTFAESQAGYAKLWAKMVVNPADQGQVNIIASRLYGQKSRYQIVERLTGCPWFVVALIDQMEHGQSLGLCNSHLHNGDPLSARTIHVPVGRPPPPAEPPFVFEDSAVDAIRYDKLNQVPVWSLEMVAYQLEKFNGFGYIAVNINTPYLWSFTQYYLRGKYVSDGKFDPNAVSGQAGAMPVFRSLMQLDPSVLEALKMSALPPSSTTPATPAPVPAPSLQPTMLGLTLAQWAVITAAHPTILADIMKLTPPVQQLLAAINADLQGTRT